MRVGFSSGSVLSRYENNSRSIDLANAMNISRVLTNDSTFMIDEANRIYENNIEKDEFFITDKLYKKIDRAIDSYNDEEDLMRFVARCFLNSLNLGVVAVFRNDWTESRLRRFDIQVADKFTRNVADAYERYPEFKEEVYFPCRGQYVTELAWNENNERRKFITDYEMIKARTSEQVNNVSYEWHEMVVNRVTSTMYGIIGGTQVTNSHQTILEKRYIFRCFNRSDFGRLPLDIIQYQLLQKMCEHISNRIYINKMEQHFCYLQEMNKQLQRVPNNIKDKMDIFCRWIEIAGIESIAIIWSQGDHKLTEGYVYGPDFDEWERTDKQSYLVEDSVFSRRIINSSNPIAFPTCNLQATPNTIEDRISQINKSKGHKSGWLLGYPFNTRAKKGALIIPVKCPVVIPSDYDLLPSIPETDYFLRNYASIASSLLSQAE